MSKIQVTKTSVLQVDPAHIDDQIIGHAANLIRSGELVAFPTETVYGLGANALDGSAVARIYAAKGRPAADPVIVHIGTIEQLADVASAIPDLAKALVAEFWPGPLTLILPKGARIPAEVSAGLPTVGIRMPAHPVALRLIAVAGLPIAAPSANRFAHTSPTTAQHVLDDLGGKIPLILDGGRTTVGVESTILDLSGERPRLLRPGGIPLDTLKRLLPDIEVVARYARSGEEALPAPGMLLRHYSPRAELRLIEGSPDAVRIALVTEAENLRKQGRAAGLLVADEDCADLSRFPFPLVSLGSAADLNQIARNLFAGLRELDAYGVEIILARAYPPTGIGLAIRDRLLRAAEGRITTARRI